MYLRQHICSICIIILHEHVIILQDVMCNLCVCVRAYVRVYPLQIFRPFCILNVEYTLHVRWSLYMYRDLDHCICCIFECISYFAI